jgi:hypothetical protein
LLGQTVGLGNGRAKDSTEQVKDCVPLLGVCIRAVLQADVKKEDVS